MGKGFVTSEELVDQDPVGFLSAVRALEFDKARRRSRAETPTVIDYDPGDDDGPDLVPPGVIGVFVAPRGSDFLSDVRTAYSKSDAGAVAELAERAVADVHTRPRMTFKQAAADLIGGRPYGDLRYRGKTLAECIGLVDGIAFGVLPLAYVGGALEADAFSFVEYLPPESLGEELEVVLVTRPPHLSKVETELLRRERDRFANDLQFDEVLIGRGGRVAVTVTTITIVLFVVAVHTPTLTGGMDQLTIRERFARASALSEARVKSLGSAATVGDLMAARADVLSRSY